VCLKVRVALRSGARQGANSRGEFETSGLLYGGGAAPGEERSDEGNSSGRTRSLHGREHHVYLVLRSTVREISFVHLDSVFGLGTWCCCSFPCR